MSEKRLDLLVSPGFLTGLGLLILNDFALKSLFHSWFTGKLSDLAGLFVFPLFWTAFFQRFRSTIYIVTVPSFIFWKSSCSEPLISAWNSLAFSPIARTVDYTDLFTLAILPVSYFYSRRAPQALTSRFTISLLSLVSVVAFTATSFRNEVGYGNTYRFEESKADLIKKMELLLDVKYFDHAVTSASQSDTFEISFNDCASEAMINISALNGQSVITLSKMVDRCPSGGKEQMLRFFEKEFIDKLRERQPSASLKVKYIRLLSSK